MSHLLRGRARSAKKTAAIRGLHMLLGFDPTARYQALGRRYDEAKLEDAAAFVRTRTGRIKGG